MPSACMERSKGLSALCIQVHRRLMTFVNFLIKHFFFNDRCKLLSLNKMLNKILRLGNINYEKMCSGKGLILYNLTINSLMGYSFLIGQYNVFFTCINTCCWMCVSSSSWICLNLNISKVHLPSFLFLSFFGWRLNTEDNVVMSSLVIKFFRLIFIKK